MGRYSMLDHSSWGVVGPNVARFSRGGVKFNRRRLGRECGECLKVLEEVKQQESSHLIQPWGKVYNRFNIHHRRQQCDEMPFDVVVYLPVWGSSKFRVRDLKQLSGMKHVRERA